MQTINETLSDLLALVNGAGDAAEKLVLIRQRCEAAFEAEFAFVLEDEDCPGEPILQIRRFHRKAV